MVTFRICSPMMRRNGDTFFLLYALTLVWCRQVQGHPCRESPSVNPRGVKINCRGLHLRRIPDDLPKDTVWLDLTDNNLKNLTDFMFNDFPLLVHLDLTSCALVKLNEKCFWGLNRLRYLGLDHNGLRLDNETYPADIFLPLEELNFLSLSGNDNGMEGKIPDKVFRHLPNLESLYIDTFINESFGPGFAVMKKLKYLYLTGIKWKDEEHYCSIKNLHNDTFTFFENSSIEYLNLDSCILSNIDVDTFTPLRVISTIIMTAVEYLPIQSAIRSLFGLNGKTVKKIKLDKSYKYVKTEVDQQIIKAESVERLENVCIEYLDLSDNSLLFVAPELVSVLSRCLKHIDLSKNILLGSLVAVMMIGKCNMLEYVDLSRQQRFVRGKEPTHTLKKSITSPKFILPSKLRLLDMSSMSRNMFSVSQTHFLNGSSLEFVNVSYNGIKNLSYAVTGIENIKYLDLSGNIGYGINDKFLSSFPNLKQLFMNGMIFEELALLEGSSFNRVVKSLVYIEKITLESNRIRFLDNTIFEEMDNLTYISLADNKLTSISIDLKPLTKLSHLDMSLNSLTHLTRMEMDFFDTLEKETGFSLNLRQNPISCSCKHLEFINWLFSTKIILDNKGDYNCVTEDGDLKSTRQVYERYLYHWRSCQGRFWLPVSVTFLCLLLVVMLTWVVVFKNWMQIQHRLLIILGKVAKKATRHDFQKDAFIAHCEEDTRAVSENVERGLEKYKLRLVLPHKDFLPGRFVAENIVESIEESWKTVIIVTPDFLSDPWSYFIMRSVSLSVSVHNPNRVIVLLIGDVDRGRLPESFVNIIEEEDVLELDAFPAFNSQIWKQIKDMILA